MEHHSNEWYLNGLREQSDEVTQAMMEDFLPMVIHYVTTNSGTRMDAEDLFQDAWVVVFRIIENEGFSLNENTKFSTYFFAICRNMWLKELRKKKHDAGVTPEELPVSTLVAEAEIEDAEAKEIERAIKQTQRHKLINDKFNLLSDGCRKVLDLSWHTDMSMEEIAVEMNWTYGYARKKKHECIEKLRCLIKGDRRYDELK